METKYIKVKVSDRLPLETDTYMTSHGWFTWYNGLFYNDEDEEIYYVNYWLEEVPDREAEMIDMLKTARDIFLDLKHDKNLPELKEIQWEIEDLIKEATELK